MWWFYYDSGLGQGIQSPTHHYPYTVLPLYFPTVAPLYIRTYVCMSSSNFSFLPPSPHLLMATVSLSNVTRGKTQELSQEISRLSQEIDSHQKENAAYLSYEQRSVST